MTIEPIPRTLYRRPSSPKSSFLLCLPDGKCWCLSPVWSLPKQENPPTWTPTPADVEMWQIVASNLTDEEIASLDSPEGREERVSALVASRTLGAALISAIVAAKAAEPAAARKPTPDGCDEAEVERWRKAAERAEIDRREWQALALNHEGAIERLTRDLAEARETRDRALYAERAAGSRADAAEAEVERLRQVIVGLAAKIAGVRWLTAENPDPR